MFPSVYSLSLSVTHTHTHRHKFKAGKSNVKCLFLQIEDSIQICCGVGCPLTRDLKKRMHGVLLMIQSLHRWKEALLWASREAMALRSNCLLVAAALSLRFKPLAGSQQRSPTFNFLAKVLYWSSCWWIGLLKLKPSYMFWQVWENAQEASMNLKISTMLSLFCQTLRIHVGLNTIPWSKHSQYMALSLLISYEWARNAESLHCTSGRIRWSFFSNKIKKVYRLFGYPWFVGTFPNLFGSCCMPTWLLSQTCRLFHKQISTVFNKWCILRQTSTFSSAAGEADSFYSTGLCFHTYFFLSTTCEEYFFMFSVFALCQHLHEIRIFFLESSKQALFATVHTLSTIRPRLASCLFWTLIKIRISWNLCSLIHQTLTTLIPSW